MTHCNGYTTENTTQGGLTSDRRLIHEKFLCSMMRAYAAPTPNDVGYGHEEEDFLSAVLLALYSGM